MDGHIFIQEECRVIMMIMFSITIFVNLRLSLVSN